MFGCGSSIECVEYVVQTTLSVFRSPYALKFERESRQISYVKNKGHKAIKQGSRVACQNEPVSVLE